MNFRIQCDDCGEWFDSDSNEYFYLSNYGTCAECSGVRTDESDDDEQGSEMSDMVRCMECGQAYESDSEDAEAIEEHGECIKCGNFNDGE